MTSPTSGSADGDREPHDSPPTPSPVRGETGPPGAPEVAKTVFGDRLALAERYAATLADSGATRGLIGPREVPRLWERHLLNCAVVHEAIPHGASVIDVGTGAGLPGMVLAIVRPDLQVHLVEPLLRRTTWLAEVIASLDLPGVTVHRMRAEQAWGDLHAPVVTARAVAPLAELARWCLPLVEPGGVVLAMKGTSAPEELRRDRETVRSLGSVDEVIETYGQGLLDPVTTVVRMQVEEAVRPRQTASRTRRGGRRRAPRPRR